MASTESNIQKQIEAAAKKQSHYTAIARLSQKRLVKWRRKWRSAAKRVEKLKETKPGSPDLAATQKAEARFGRKTRFWRSRRDFSLRRRAFWKAVLERRKIKLARWIEVNRRIDWNGYPELSNRKVRKVLRYAQRKHNFVVTSTTGGQHAPTSWHYQGRAVDGVCADMAACQIDLENHFGAEYFLELFGPASRYVKNGYVINAKFPDHDDHIHFAA
jgi:hypothetical protein